MRERYGIIFVHGIVWNNHIFDFLAPLVAENYESRFINLNGYGGDALAFLKTSMAECANARIFTSVYKKVSSRVYI